MENFEKEALAVLGRLSGADGTTWVEYAVIAVFRACYTSAISKDHINRIICAIHGISADENELNAAMRKLVRAKILRSRVVSKGRRLYEINV